MVVADIFGTDYKALAERLEEDRKSGKRIVMCPGTFDLFHIGHMKILNVAKENGDILIVAVKSDKAATLKKEEPPILNQKIRMETIANYPVVDYVILTEYDEQRIVPFKSENLSSSQWLNMFYPIINIIKPDCFVYEDNPTLLNARNQLFSRFNVEGIMHHRTEGISTTEIINEIKTRFLIQLQKDSEKR